jgi:hypothetical protein
MQARQFNPYPWRMHSADSRLASARDISRSAADFHAVGRDIIEQTI